MTTPEPQYTILRIKRKITDDPLEALLIDDASTSSSSSSSRPIKKSRSASSNQPVASSSRGIFRLAETVPEGWEPTKDGEALKTRIAQLIAQGYDPSSLSPSSSSSPAAQPPAAPAPAASRVQAQDQLPVRYRIVNPLPAPSRTTRAPLRGPPKLQIESEMRSNEAATKLFKLLDAHQIPSSLNSERTSLPRQSPFAGGEQRSGGSGGGGNKIREEAEDDPDVAAFLPMLREYLSVSNPSPSPSLSSTTPSPSPSQATHNPIASLTSDPTTSTGQGKEEAYVYDLYYRSILPPPPPLSSSSGIHTPGIITRATVEGYLEEGEDLVGSNDDDDDGEGDVGDEDSNDEDFYRNDYPDEDDDNDDYEHDIDSSAGSYDSDSRERWEEDY